MSFDDNNDPNDYGAPPPMDQDRYGGMNQPGQDFGQDYNQPYQQMPYPAPQQGGGGGKTLMMFMGAGCGCLALVAIAFVGFIFWAAGQPEALVSGEQMTEETRTYLADNSLLEPGERVIYYYDDSLSLDNSKSCFFTDRRVVAHEQGVSTKSVEWEEIDEVRNREEFLAYFLMIRTKEGELWECELTIEGPRFHEALLMTWEGKKAKE